jgi:hypothetical protein
MTDQQRLERFDGPVRLTLSAHVANELDELQRTLAELAERMGHSQCASGCDTLYLQLEREFSTSADKASLNPQPLPPREPPPSARRINVLVPEKVSNDLDALQKAIAITVGKLGCQACCSGFDIAFRRELDLLALDENLEAQGFGRFR